jgi:serine/threonine protein kinase
MMNEAPISSEGLRGGILVGGKYKLGQRIGSGSFGSIYRGLNVSNGAKVAIKLEHAKSRNAQLEYEARVYKVLSSGAVGIPKVRWFGVEGDYNVMVLDLLGPSLEQLFYYCDRKFSLKTVLMLADQCLRRLEFMHSKSILHRDLKPDSMFLLDFFLFSAKFPPILRCVN